jgi:predicted permease
MSRPCFFVQPSTGVTRVEHLDVCPQISADGSLVYTLLTPTELDKILGVSDLFGFDPEIFSLIVLYFILLFLAGYFTGLIARKLGR